MNDPMFFVRLAAWSILTLAAGAAQAQDRACWAQASVVVLNKPVVIDDCCPAKPQAICKNAKSPSEDSSALRIDVHNYARDAEALKTLTQACSGLEGAWVAGTR